MVSLLPMLLACVGPAQQEAVESSVLDEALLVVEGDTLSVVGRAVYDLKKERFVEHWMYAAGTWWMRERMRKDEWRARKKKPTEAPTDADPEATPTEPPTSDGAVPTPM